jgi:hypothetical protein
MIPCPIRIEVDPDEIARRLVHRLLAKLGKDAAASETPIFRVNQPQAAAGQFELVT